MLIHLAASNESSQPNTKELVVKHVDPILLDLSTLVPILNKYHLLTTNDNYILINPLIPPVERASALLYKILPSKGPEVYETFVKCLQEEKEHLGHQELVRRLKSVSNTYVANT